MGWGDEFRATSWDGIWMHWNDGSRMMSWDDEAGVMD